MIFLMEATVFMLIGTSLRGVIEHVGGFGVVLDQFARPVLLILLALTLARFAWVFASDLVVMAARLSGLSRKTPLGLGCSTVLGWAGMRGVVTLAVALSVPDGFPGRDLMLLTAFAVILIPVLVQGTTLGAVIRWARLVEPEAERVRLTASQAEAIMAKAQVRLVESRAYDEEGKLIHPQLLERYRRKATIYANYAGNEEDYAPRLHAHFDLVLEAIAAGRAELLRLHRAGDIDEETLHALERVLDLEEVSALAAKA
jgi:CPA1 family monovalent cation:H+ antiporter